MPTIDELPVATTVSLTDLLPADQGSSAPGTGTTRSVTFQQQINAIPSATAVVRGLVTYGIAPGTAAQGNDARIVGAYQASNPAGYQTAAQVLAYRLDQFAAPNVSLSIGSQKLINVTDPTDAQDAATKAYVDTHAAGLQAKSTARLAATVALPASVYANGAGGVGATLTAVGFGALTIDGVACNILDRVVIANQASALENGVYDVTDPGAAAVQFVLTRSTDMDQPAEVVGAMVPVSAGVANAGALFICGPVTPVTIGVSALPFDELNLGTGYAPINSPAFTGTPTTTAPAVGDATFRIPTTSWVAASYAPLASPTLTGAPLSPTPPVGDNSTRIATTAFYMNEAASVAPLPDGVAAIGVSTRFARQDHVHPLVTFTLVATIAALRAATVLTLNSAAPAYVDGYTTSRDGGEGDFVYDAADLISADNGGTIIVDASGRRWKRSIAGDERLSVKWFGAKGDAITDDTAAINATLAAVPSAGGVVYFPSGTYIISATIAIPLTALPIGWLGSGLEITGDGQASVIRITDPSLPFMECISPPGAYRWNLTISKLYFDGDDTHANYQIFIQNIHNFTLRDCILWNNNANGGAANELIAPINSGVKIIGVGILGPYYWRFEHNQIYGGYIELNNCTDGWVTDNIIQGITPNPVGTRRFSLLITGTVSNAKIRRNHIYSNILGGVYSDATTIAITIEGNHFDPNPAYNLAIGIRSDGPLNENWIVTGNDFNAIPARSLWFTDLVHSVIANNVFSECGNTGPVDTIRFDSVGTGCSHNSVHGNVAVNNSNVSPVFFIGEQDGAVTYHVYGMNWASGAGYINFPNPSIDTSIYIGVGNFTSLHMQSYVPITNNGLFLQLPASPTGAGEVQIEAVGADANIHIALVPKGSGMLNVISPTAAAATAGGVAVPGSATGFLEVLINGFPMRIPYYSP